MDLQESWQRAVDLLTASHDVWGSDELTAVFPEGYKGLGKNFRDRYKLQRFGRGGFVSAALRAGRIAGPPVRPRVGLTPVEGRRSPSCEVRP